MFREIAYTSMIMSFTSFGTEIIYRAKLVDDVNDAYYFLQSDLVIVLTIIQTLVSLYIIRKLNTLTALRMRLLNAFVDAFLIAAITLRAKYNFFMPLDSIRYSLYNITSFFLCVQTFTFLLFWFYRGPYEDREDTYSLRPPRRSRRHHNSSTPTVHRYDEEIDYTLPSYSELPAPPAYTKTVVPENSISNSDEESNEVSLNAQTSSNMNQSTEPMQHENSAHPNITAINTTEITAHGDEVAGEDLARTDHVTIILDTPSNATVVEENNNNNNNEATHSDNNGIIHPAVARVSQSEETPSP